MPLEIRELVIKATVAPNDASQASVSGSRSGNSNISGSEEIINICVEKVLDILKKKNER